jgi:hypothetical protein
MAKTAFSKGSEVTAAWANAITNPVYAQNPSNDGELPAPTNADLSQAPGQIVPEWTEFRDQLKVSATSGLGIQWQGGTIRDAGTGVFVVPAGTLNLANNATNWVHVNTSGSVVSSTTEPGVGVMMARITTASGAVQTLVDLRRAYGVGPISKIINYFGGTGIDGPKACTNGETLRGIYNFTTFTVPSGFTVTIDKFARIYCTGNVSIQGTVNVSTAVGGGVGFSTGISGGALGGTTGNGLGGGSGTGTSGPYHFTASSLGSGGGSGFCINGATQASTIPSGGVGGGALLIEAIGTVSITGSINANGGAGISGFRIAGTNQPLSGSGGGSGGLLWITSLASIIATGGGVTLSARGGNGGDAVAGANANGGGGGGGGWIVLAAPNVNATGANVLVGGGAAGTTIGSPATNLGGGTGGSFAGQGGSSATGGVFAGGTGTFSALTNILSIG